MRTAVCLLLTGALFAGYGVCQGKNAEERVLTGQDVATTRYYSKGGIGIVNENVYVVVKSAVSDQNEVILVPAEGTEERWKGKTANQAQVVFVYAGKVWGPDNLPDQFDLSQAVVISFEVNRIRFFDFQQNAGGYYERIRK